MSCALDLETRYQICFWDALIVQAAVSCGEEILYSEDWAEGQKYSEVRVEILCNDWLFFSTQERGLSARPDAGGEGFQGAEAQFFVELDGAVID